MNGFKLVGFGIELRNERIRACIEWCGVLDWLFTKKVELEMVANDEIMSS